MCGYFARERGLQTQSVSVATDTPAEVFRNGIRGRHGAWGAT
jgi:hypothetical protein